MTQNLISESQIFRAAVSLNPEHRSKYLDVACGDDLSLRAEVELLLHAHDPECSFLSSPAAVITTDQPIAEKLGTLIGPYKLLEQIGEGGMGVVYVAEQTEPVRRRVALKIIKPGMDTKQVIARFEAERQALAMMDHPNIARVLEAGTTDNVRPYFAMELVRGMAITEYCDKAKLDPRKRLELFVTVCQAVQHAHQKGIIHRDLKPSNVMVTLHDGTPVVKVIDFGVAKAMGQQLTDRTIYTAHAQLVGTPLYMSPEQAEMSGLDVDTRSDVYSLGVLLYELLTGQTPFDKETLSKAGLDEMHRIIREDEPLRPSRRFSTLGAAAISTVSQHRSLDERRLSKVLCGELDWIVMKSLEKDRSRRYESASSLAADIQRYLSDEPVLACPPTTMYRFQKFARKHKPALATAAAIAACLILGTTVSAWQAVRATSAEAQATANEQKAVANEQKAEVNEQKAIASAVAAKEKEQEAVTQRDEARGLAEKLQAALEQLRRTTYTAQMNLAHHAWEKANVVRVRELLDQQRPKPGEPDLRGFEWSYLHRLCHSELLTLKGHTSGVESVAYSPDGKRLATGSLGTYDRNTRAYVGEVKVWDAQTGKELLTFQGPGRCVIFSPDGKRLVCAGAITNGVKVCDAETGREILTLKGGADGGGVFIGYANIAFSPDGQRLATGAGASELADGTRVAGGVKVWDVQTGQKLLDLKHNGREGVVFSPDGKRLAASGSDGLKVWDAQTGEELLTLEGRTWSTRRNVVFSPDGKQLASTSWGYGPVWDAQTGQDLLALKGHTDSVRIVAYSPDGKRLATGSRDNTVKVWDAKTGKEIRTFRGCGRLVAFSPDGKRLASSSEDNTVKVWDAEKDQGSRSLWVGPGWSTAFSPDFKRLAIANSDHTVKIRDAETGKVTFTFKGHTVPVLCVAFSPDGKRLASGGGGQTTPDGGYSRPRGAPTELKIFDAETGQELHILKGHSGDVIEGVVFSPDGKCLASLDADGTVKVWDAQIGQEMRTLTGPRGSGPFPTVVYSPDGKRLASAGVGGVKVWDATTGQEQLSLKSDGYGVAFSPDGKRLASVGKVWDAQTGQERLSLKGDTLGYGTGVAFSPDGKRLANASGRGVKVWDAQTGQELLTLSGPLSGQPRLAFLNDHKLVSAAGWVRLWDATPLPEQP